MIIAIAWAVAGVIALVVGVFCGYEVHWKLARLRADLAGLDDIVAELTDVQSQLRSAAARLSTPSGGS